jgi:uncharacterized protein YbjT (DUF2867 family)
MAYKAVIVGASGLIGSKLLSILLNWPEYDEIISLGRKKIALKNKKLTQFIVDFDHLDSYSEHINGRAVFCCLGTTRKKTPDLKEYRVIDYDYPLKLAEIAKKNKVKQYHFVSALGANPDSSAFYLKMKGETEQGIQSVGMDCVRIYQPSLLTGQRNERRLGERLALQVMKVLDPLLPGPFKKYRSIPAYTVAMAMFKESLKNKDGLFIHPSEQIKQLV